MIRRLQLVSFSQSTSSNVLVDNVTLLTGVSQIGQGNSFRFESSRSTQDVQLYMIIRETANVRSVDIVATGGSFKESKNRRAHTIDAHIRQWRWFEGNFDSLGSLNRLLLCHKWHSERADRRLLPSWFWVGVPLFSLGRMEEDWPRGGRER
jgi:hypothetical protein